MTTSKERFKWGTELATWPLSFLGASIRYDCVIFEAMPDKDLVKIQAQMSF